MFSGRKDKKARKRFLCNRKDMRLIDERFDKKYRYRYLVAYLRKHHDEHS